MKLTKVVLSLNLFTILILPQQLLGDSLDKSDLEYKRDGSTVVHRVPRGLIFRVFLNQNSNRTRPYLNFGSNQNFGFGNLFSSSSNNAPRPTTTTTTTTRAPIITRAPNTRSNNFFGLGKLFSASFGGGGGNSGGFGGLGGLGALGGLGGFGNQRTKGRLNGNSSPPTPASRSTTPVYSATKATTVSSSTKPTVNNLASRFGELDNDISSDVKPTDTKNLVNLGNEVQITQTATTTTESPSKPEITEESLSESIQSSDSLLKGESTTVKPIENNVVREKPKIDLRFGADEEEDKQNPLTNNIEITTYSPKLRINGVSNQNNNPSTNFDSTAETKPGYTYQDPISTKSGLEGNNGSDKLGSTSITQTSITNPDSSEMKPGYTYQDPKPTISSNQGYKYQDPKTTAQISTGSQEGYSYVYPKGTVATNPDSQPGTGINSATNPGYNYQNPETTAQTNAASKPGYTYQNPQPTGQTNGATGSGYSYQDPKQTTGTTAASKPGYNYQNPQSTGQSNGATGSGYSYQDPKQTTGTTNAASKPGYTYQNPLPTGQANSATGSGYSYQDPKQTTGTTNAASKPGYNYQNPQPTSGQTNGATGSGYSYQDPKQTTGTTNAASKPGYTYQNPQPTGQTNGATGSGYSYQDPQQTAGTTNPASKPGYTYQNPQPTGQTNSGTGSGYSYVDPKQTTNPATKPGYNYQNPQPTGQVNTGTGYSYMQNSGTNQGTTNTQQRETIKLTVGSRLGLSGDFSNTDTTGTGSGYPTVGEKPAFSQANNQVFSGVSTESTSGNTQTKQPINSRDITDINQLQTNPSTTTLNQLFSSTTEVGANGGTTGGASQDLSSRFSQLHTSLEHAGNIEGNNPSLVTSFDQLLSQQNGQSTTGSTQATTSLISNQQSGGGQTTPHIHITLPDIEEANRHTSQLIGDIRRDVSKSGAQANQLFVSPFNGQQNIPQNYNNGYRFQVGQTLSNFDFSPKIAGATTPNQQYQYKTDNSGFDYNNSGYLLQGRPNVRNGNGGFIF